MTFEKNARIASQKDFAIYQKNVDAHKAKGIVIVREQGNWIVVNLKKFVSQDFWKAWRTSKTELKEIGYRVARVYDHWIVY